MASKAKQVLNILKKFTKDEILELFSKALDIAAENEPAKKCDCPYCAGKAVIRFGKKRGKQRFFCKNCERTFITTTGTVMSMSHQPRAVWDGMIMDTLYGNSLSYSENRLGISHQVAFNMRHKILLALELIEQKNPTSLNEVTELDETFVLECYKGKKLPASVGRKARRHGAKAQKRGISSEYICICAGAQRNSNVFMKAVNRAKPSSAEISEVFDGHIADGTLLLTDGLKSYKILESSSDCSIKNVEEEKTSFYNLNTVNNLHSSIKEQYRFYRGVATKYINRYCAMFARAYRKNKSDLRELKDALLTPGKTIAFSIKDVKTLGLAVL